MDEPLNGLDVDSIEALYLALKKHCQNGKAVLIACHDAAFIKEVCTEIIEIDKGKIIRQGHAEKIDIGFSIKNGNKRTRII